MPMTRRASGADQHEVSATNAETVSASGAVVQHDNSEYTADHSDGTVVDDSDCNTNEAGQDDGNNAHEIPALTVVVVEDPDRIKLLEADAEKPCTTSTQEERSDYDGDRAAHKGELQTDRIVALQEDDPNNTTSAQGTVDDIDQMGVGRPVEDIQGNPDNGDGCKRAQVVEIPTKAQAEQEGGGESESTEEEANSNSESESDSEQSDSIGASGSDSEDLGSDAESASSVSSYEFDTRSMEASESESDSDLEKAHESLRLKSREDTAPPVPSRLPKLDPGVSVPDMLYLKMNKKGVVSLRSENIHDVDGASSSSLQRRLKPRSLAPKLSPKQKRELREKTTGPDWFDMPKPEITPEIKRDLQLIRMRHVLDPKRFYKKDASAKDLPKYFQFGTVIESPNEFYSGRIPRKERKKTLVQQLLADEKATSYYKRKFLEIQERKQSGGKKFYKRLVKRRKPNWEKGF